MGNADNPQPGARMQANIKDTLTWIQATISSILASINNLNQRMEKLETSTPTTVSPTDLLPTLTTEQTVTQGFRRSYFPISQSSMEFLSFASQVSADQILLSHSPPQSFSHLHDKVGQMADTLFLKIHSSSVVQWSKFSSGAVFTSGQKRRLSWAP
ncbi:Hypothetical predicted protein [Pelobates cultripes]|uniref:Uncharacterized protein n=1 Tax=Pelobates cultripes TaxID=61616 RepID=A0AAD1W150_PELCU|nr:Hypothetical predicted protein [Pelobates cultripes]